MVKLADTPDFGCVTTVHLYPACSRQVKIKSKIRYAGVAELADARDFDCVTTVHLFPVSSRQVKIKSKIEYAGVAELADARDLGSRAARCAGSIPVTRTKLLTRTFYILLNRSSLLFI